MTIAAVRTKLLFLVVLGFGAMFVLLASGCREEGVADPASDDATVPVQSGAMHKSGRFYSGTIIASDPSIRKNGSDMEMFYTDLDMSKERTVIARAESTDGVNWQPQGEADGIKGLVIAGKDGAWDENIESAAVTEGDGGYLLFYSGYRDKGTPMKGFPAALGLATSTDGKNFTRASDAPVMEPTKGWYDNDAIYSPTILRDGGLYHMIYVGHSYTDFSKIGAGGVYLLHASSPDGRNWTKSPEPVARPGQFDDWRRDGLAEPYLIKRGKDDYLLFYTGLDGEKRAIGVATGPSPTGPWAFGSKPLIVPGQGSEQDAHQVLAPAVMLDGENLRVWYLGANTKGALKIGEATGNVEEAISATR
ncbi:hypothetical protein [Pseudorhodobacter sp.]|uniref:hypothetical protein n=1 Tax=Pseudorhodobacter sp. TaxID=1934400 RepID=UPI0026486351|nr:hypothetical protein [Pseudorhodobacter sp.]MDN5785907.1 hypothetical protein [Pseudorhodobacter sp.]